MEYCIVLARRVIRFEDGRRPKEGDGNGGDFGFSLVEPLFSIFGRNAHVSTFRNGETVRYSVFGYRKAGRAEQPNACIVITLDNQAQ